MQKLILHASALIGLLIFLKQAWTYAPLDRALLTSLGTGLAIYLVLFLGALLVRRIAAHTPPPSENNSSDKQPQESSSSAQPSQAEASASRADSPSESPSPAEQESSADPVAASMA